MKRLYQAARRVEHERCDLCAAPLGERHDHLYEPSTRSIRCACQGCALIVPSSSYARYRRIPDLCTRVDLDAESVLATAPVALAIVIARDDGRRVVCFPGPAGIVEGAAIELDAVLEPEVEALLVTHAGVWRVGIDVVFRLIAELRGAVRETISPGPEAIARVVAQLEAR